MEQRDLQPGETWTFRDRWGREWTETVTRREGDLILVQTTYPRDQLLDFYYQAGEAAVRVVNRETGEILRTHTAFGQWLSFPLFVGKRWVFEFEVPNSWDGRLNRYRNTLEVVAYEPVIVRAGTFLAFKVKLIQENLSWPWAGSMAYWYAPAVKAIIKVEYGQGWRLPDHELTTYTVRP